MSWLELTALTLAVARLTVLVRADRITRPLRWKLAAHMRPGGYLRYLLACSWCIGFWIAMAAAITAYFWWRYPAYRIVTFGLAISYLVGILGGTQGEPDSDIEPDAGV